MFKKSNIKSAHRSDLNTNGILTLMKTYDAITDGEHINFQEYYKRYPNSLFILNTRPLKKWLISRYKHNFTKIGINKSVQDKNKTSWCWPPSIERTNEWIKKRKKHYNNVKQFFRDKPNQLKIINIEEPKWEIQILKFINKYKYYKKKNNDNIIIHKNKKKKSIICKEEMMLITKIVTESLKQNNCSGNEI